LALSELGTYIYALAAFKIAGPERTAEAWSICVWYTRTAFMGGGLAGAELVTLSESPLAADEVAASKGAAESGGIGVSNACISSKRILASSCLSGHCAITVVQLA
jgi:hypothetical protein